MDIDIPNDIKKINKLLVERYGSDLVYQPNFRLVWGPSLLEKRHGVFEDWYAQVIFIREYVGVREKPKYPQGIWGECYILERRWSAMNNVRTLAPKDIINWDGYEPIWSFVRTVNKRKVAVRPTWNAVEFVVKELLYGIKETLSQAWDRHENEWKKEVREVRDMLDDDLPWRVMQMKHGEGIVVPSNYEKVTDNGTK